MNTGHSIGDGLIVMALVAAFLGYTALKFRERRRDLDRVHQERLRAMEKDIPLPEFPVEPLSIRTESPPDPRVGWLIGIVLLSFAVGAMLALWLLPGARAYWPAPLPVAFLGGGLVIAYLALGRVDRDA